MILDRRKILHTARYTGTPWEILKSVTPEGFDVKTLDDLSYDCLIREAEDADYLLVSGRLPIDEGVLSAGKHLKMIQRTGVGTEMLDLEAIRRHGIPVYVNAGINARSVAEHTLTLMLACLKRITEVNAQVHQGIWKKQITGVSTHELYGKTVGLVGMGSIGRQVASLLNAFGAKVVYTDLFRQPEDVEQQLKLSFYERMDAMLPVLDILSLHCPLTAQSAGMINARTLALMKKGVILINTARGPLVNPDDLYDALRSGQVRSAGLDTHFEEPVKPDYKLAALPNVILTPHIGGLSYEAFHDMMSGAMENIAAFDKGCLAAIEKNRIV